MGLVVKEYQPYVVQDGVEYYRIGTVAEIVGRTVQMIRLWDAWSNQLEEECGKRLIPKSTRIGKGNVRCWTSDEVREIIEFSKNIKYGDLSKFSRTRWGDKIVTEDRSTEARKAKQEYRKEVNRNGKRIQRQRKVEEIKRAKGEMLRMVRRRANRIYNDLNL